MEAHHAQAITTLGTVALTLALGCTSRSDPTTATSRDPGPTDLVGTWDIAFRLSPDSPAETYFPDTEIDRTAVIHGRLEISADSVRWGEYYVLRAQFSADFWPMLGRAMSCLSSAEETWVSPRDFILDPPAPVFRIWFTPGAADCGLDAAGAFSGGSATGGWSEGHLLATTVFGTFVMTRSD